MEALGINPIYIIAQLISFGILFAVLGKFLYPQLRKALEERRARIAAAIEKEQELTKKVEKLALESKKRQQESQAEARAVLAEAKKATEELRKQILAESEEKSQRIVEEAKVRIEEERKQAEVALRGHAAALGRQMAEQILAENQTTAKGRRTDFENTLKKLKKQKPKE